MIEQVALPKVACIKHPKGRWAFTPIESPSSETTPFDLERLGYSQYNCIECVIESANNQDKPNLSNNL